MGYLLDLSIELLKATRHRVCFACASKAVNRTLERRGMREASPVLAKQHVHHFFVCDFISCSCGTKKEFAFRVYIVFANSLFGIYVTSKPFPFSQPNNQRTHHLVNAHIQSLSSCLLWMSYKRDIMTLDVPELIK